MTTSSKLYKFEIDCSSTDTRATFWELSGLLPGSPITQGIDCSSFHVASVMARIKEGSWSSAIAKVVTGLLDDMTPNEAVSIASGSAYQRDIDIIADAHIDIKCSTAQAGLTLEGYLFLTETP